MRLSDLLQLALPPAIALPARGHLRPSAAHRCSVNPTTPAGVMPARSWQVFSPYLRKEPRS